MSDIFISYARSTEIVAGQIGEALRRVGHKVWRDDELPAHRNYGEVIEERLRSAKAVVVIWSADALTSQWVRAEADVARENGTLVQLSCDGTVPPLPFNQIQCADLRGWAGDLNHPGWVKIADSVTSLAGPPLGTMPSRDDSAGPGGTHICVLPFINMSGDGEQEYFSDGITEDIITDLSRLSGLRVVSRNTAFAFKGQIVDIRNLAKELGVSHVIEGSVRKAGDRVRISAQLIEAINAEPIWANRYDRNLDDIFAIQDEISSAIVDALKIELLPKEKKAISERSTTGNSEAYDLYLLARQHWIKSTGTDKRLMEITIRICQQAVDLDPTYAKAWGLMALAQMRINISHDPSFDPTDATEKALSLDPKNVEALCAKAIMLSTEEKSGQAREMLAHALELDPNSFEVHKEVARDAFLNGELDRAISHYEKALNMMDDDFHSAGMLVTCYHAKGDREKEEQIAKVCVERVERALKRDPGDGNALSMGIAGLATLGDHERVRKWIDRAMMIDPNNHLMRYNLACTLVVELGDNERALELLKPYFENVTPKWIQHTVADPDLDKVRDDPRFIVMLEEAQARLEKQAQSAE
ncbi:TIR domain-containing protein [Sphingomicrobium sediminis]|uniref:TIR domain-containing protein n=1 Tax=Sphingomicrobium sediminis TaxID=2950949 RepID=A0A9X2EFN0_9SPHN|nr:TIR domain-containing protein [Sphingomicrobium sediminis]MCM8556670.1 TIR domain-containing protein [Sphingomicrobium sediminis]